MIAGAAERPVRQVCALSHLDVPVTWSNAMRAMMTFLLWCLLLVLCWPVAVLAIVLFPLVWLIALPFRVAGLALSGLFAFLGTIFMLPARMLGGGRRTA